MNWEFWQKAAATNVLHFSICVKSFKKFSVKLCMRLIRQPGGRLSQSVTRDRGGQWQPHPMSIRHLETHLHLDFKTDPSLLTEKLEMLNWRHNSHENYSVKETICQQFHLTIKLHRTWKWTLNDSESELSSVSISESFPLFSHCTLFLWQDSKAIYESLSWLFIAGKYP